MSSNEAWQMAPVLGMRNVRAAVETFTKPLGFRVVGTFEPRGEDGMIYAILERGGCELHLQIRRGELRTQQSDALHNDVYVPVADADALHEELVARGAQILRRPENQPYGQRDFAAAVPEGHCIIFGAPALG